MGQKEVILLSSKPLDSKIFVIVLCIPLIIIYILFIAPILVALRLIIAKNTTRAVSDLIIKEIFNPFGLFDIFFRD